MKTCIKKLFLVPALIAGLSLILVDQMTAQTFTTLHSFTARNNFTNSDGINPFAGVILTGDTLYGTTDFSGPARRGTVFKVTTNGSDFTTLHSFTGGSDGYIPEVRLILSD
ncbi:MAG: hypothetical protein M3Y82_05420, partial [Verrucomicrobiota bacterium]|nr:hypothetical protein [Verrucomicrobiota bacterium]